MEKDKFIKIGKKTLKLLNLAKSELYKHFPYTRKVTDDFTVYHALEFFLKKNKVVKDEFRGEY